MKVKARMKAVNGAFAPDVPDGLELTLGILSPLPAELLALLAEHFRPRLAVPYIKLTIELWSEADEQEWRKGLLA